MYAETYADRRVFCAGDAVHRHPPSNGLGSNTSIQDAYNLAWKLRHVLDGTAAPALLDTYSAERAPVGRQIVDARQQEHRRDRARLRGAGRAVHRRPRTDVAQHRRPQGRHRRGREAAAAAARGHRRQGVRVQRARRGDEPAVHLGPRSSPTAPPTPASTATRSCTTSPPPGPAPNCRTPGSPAAATASRPSTSAARAGSPSSPASAATAGGRRPSRAPRAGHRGRHRRHRARPGVRGPLRRLGEPARKRRTAAPCWPAPTTTSASATPRPHRTPRTC